MSSVEASAQWIEIEGHYCFHWHYRPTSTPNGLVVLVPPIAHEAFHGHRFYKLLANYLVEQSFEVIRFDLIGYGDSSGAISKSNCYEFWELQIHAIVEQYGNDKALTLIGHRFGANISSRIEADAHVFIEPILSVKKYAREIKATALLSEQNHSKQDSVEAGGFEYSHQLLAWLKNLDIGKLHTSRLTIIAKKTTDPSKLNFTDQDTDFITEPDLEDLLAEPQFTKVPSNLFHDIKRSIATTQKVSMPSDSHKIRYRIAPKLIGDHYEESTYFDKSEQFGIITRPKDIQHKETIVFVNSGSGVHTGPNRLYVELCRSLAMHGYQSIRFDLGNLGDSVLGDVAQENHCYPSLADEYCSSFIKSLAEDKITSNVALCGLCSGAHHAFHAGLKKPSLHHSIIMINPLTFYWKEGMSLVTPSEQRVTIDSNYYARVIKDPSAWLKLIKGKANIRYIFSFLFKLAKKKTKTYIDAIRNFKQSLPDTAFNKDIHFLRDRGIEVSIVVADSDPGWGLLEDASMMRPSTFLKKTGTHGFTVPDSNHTFSSALSREKLTKQLLTALKRK